MRKTKIKQLLFVLLMPVISFLLVGIFSFVNLSGNVFADKNGGGFFVGSNTTLNFNATISGSSATNGGGVYIANGGTFNMNGGAIYGNTATIKGDNIYNAGTFTMTGGRVGTSGSSSSGYGIYNTGTMNLYGGNVYDNVYSSANINTKMACNIARTITLGDSATITVQDYAGTTPEYNIEVSSSRQSGTIVTFKGSTVEPILSKINVTGYDSESYAVKTKKDSSGNWTISLVENSYDFPTTWKTEVASSTHMTTTVTPANLTSIKFAPTVPSGYTQIGTLSTGLPVYQGTTATDIAFVGKKIYAPKSAYKLFDNLSKLTTLDMSIFDTSNVTNMGLMFRSCSALTSLDVSNFDTSKVTGMSQMFCDCSALTSLDVSGFDTSKVIDMSSMFYLCSALTSLDVSGFNTSNVTHMSYMFDGCSKLTSLDVSGLDTSKVTNMIYMFSNCSALTSLDLSSFNMAKVTSSTNMLNFGTSNKILTLKTPYKNSTAIAITTGSTLYNVETGAVVTSVPAGTTKSLTYTNENPIKTFPTTWKTEVASSTYMTTTVTPANLTSIKFVSSVPSGYTKIGTLSTGIPVYKGTKATEIAFVAKSIFAPVNSSKLFYLLSNLTTLDMSVLNTSNVTNMNYMFGHCPALTSLDVSGFNTSNVTNMSNMFWSCSALTSLNLSNFDTSKVTDMGYMFHDCSALTSLDVRGFDTSKVTNMYYVFNNCSKLTSLDVSGFDTSNVTGMYSMFRDCSALTSLDVRGFDTSKVTKMGYMFQNCSALTSLDLSSFNMAKVTYSVDMLNFGTSNKIQTLKTPYNNSSAIAITTGSTLYNVSTETVATGVLKNTTTSQTYATRLTLTFDANGGTCNTTSATAYYNVSLHDSGFVFPYPTKSGYMFSGWYQNKSFVGTKLSLDSVFTTSCKFYAKWEEQNQPSGGGSSNSPCYISWEETGSPLVNEVSEDIKRYNNKYTLESIDGFVIISDYNYSSFQDYTLVERLNISHLPIQVYIVELNPEGPNASYINCSNCSLIVAIYVQEYAFGISNTWDAVFFDENEQLFRELAPNAIFWDLRGFCTENFKPEDAAGEPTTEQYKLILGRQVQLCILPENFYLGIDWSLSEAGCVVQNYLFEDVTGDYSFVSSKNNDQNEIYRDLAKFSLNFNKEKTIQNILNLNDEKLLETKRKIKLVSNVKKE